MSAVTRLPEADPLYARPQPQRPFYATGMLLDAQDFSDEQTYHRGRLAQAIAFISGGGTLAGLRVAHHRRTRPPARRKKSASSLASLWTGWDDWSRCLGQHVCDCNAGSMRAWRRMAAIRCGVEPMTT